MTAYVRKAYDRVKNTCGIHLGWRPLRFWGPMLQPVKPIGEYSTVCIATFYRFTLVQLETIHPQITFRINWRKNYRWDIN